MREQPLFEIVVQFAMLLETGSPVVIDDDAAVRHLEDMAAALDRLDPEMKQRLAAFLLQRAAESRSAAEDDVLRALAEALGPES